MILTLHLLALLCGGGPTLAADRAASRRRQGDDQGQRWQNLIVFSRSGPAIRVVELLQRNSQTPAIDEVEIPTPIRPGLEGTRIILDDGPGRRWEIRVENVDGVLTKTVRQLD